MKKFCLALDLKDDAVRIAEYERIHRNIWPEVKEHIQVSGIQLMELYRTGTRLFMIIETDDDFSFEAMAAKEAKDPRLQEWENFMWTFQQPLPWAKSGEKWILMDKIFSSR
ncbi:L-rhamnose mutarotase [Pollutibacter soli]|uniref:L-rhamnose mutarotase n=1 Tax=Pollutibacter soli TaxID=3034157 RepID=UPI003013D0D8